MKNQIKSTSAGLKAQKKRPETRKNSIKQVHSADKINWPDRTRQLFSKLIIPKLLNKKLVVAGVTATLFFSIGLYSLAQIIPAAQKEVQQGQKQAVEKLALESKEIQTIAGSTDMLQLSELIDVKSALEVRVETYAISINGQVIGNFESEAACQDILNLVVATYSDEEGAILSETEFKESITVTKVDRFVGSFTYFDEPEAIAHYIIKGTNQEKTHKVQSGESLWTISANNKVEVEDLIRANPNINPDRLKIDQELSLIVPKPLITVVTKETKEYPVEIPFEVVYEENAAIYKGESSVKKAGSKGEKIVQAEIIKENGVETQRIVIKEVITSQPTTKIVTKGTKDPPPRIGTGTFIRPSRGRITSNYGMRWGRRHTGIDLGMPTGTDVKASDGGKVIFAGSKSAYGLAVIIDHGGNLSTLYAHNSKLLVKKGDKVFQGQVIAKSGNTGRSTGPHLHFEVRVNGTPVDPKKYVKF